MLNLLQYYKNVRSFAKRLINAEIAWEHFDNQKSAVKAIRHETWYTYIVQYRETEANDAMNKLSDMKTPATDISYRQAKHNNAIAFLNRLDTMSS